ncbi:hypothetical protein D3C75_846940 [compost metagenome]
MKLSAAKGGMSKIAYTPDRINVRVPGREHDAFFREIQAHSKQRLLLPSRRKFLNERQMRAFAAAGVENPMRSVRGKRPACNQPGNISINRFKKTAADDSFSGGE